MAVIDKKGMMHGSVSNIVYRKYRNEQIAQIKPSKVKQTQSSKEAGLEFGLCASSAKVIREAFAPIYQGYDGAMINRFTTAVQQSIRACSSKVRGERNLHDADTAFLRGLQFNANASVDRALSVRPEVALEERQARVTLPPISLKNIKGPRADYYMIRLLLVSFDFTREVYSYTAYREIRIDYRRGFEGGSLVLDEVQPTGRLMMLSLSVHGYVSDSFEGSRSLNSASWSPAEIIEAWHSPAVEVEGMSGPVAVVPYLPLFYKDVSFSYAGAEISRKIARLREKAGPGTVKRRAEVRFRQMESTFELPKGDIGFK